MTSRYRLMLAWSAIIVALVLTLGVSGSPRSRAGSRTVRYRRVVMASTVPITDSVEACHRSSYDGDSDRRSGTHPKAV